MLFCIFSHLVWPVLWMCLDTVAADGYHSNALGLVLSSKLGNGICGPQGRTARTERGSGPVHAHVSAIFGKIMQPQSLYCMSAVHK